MNVQMLMQQAQRMQKELGKRMEVVNAELETIELQAESGGGLVKVAITANTQIKRITIDPSLLADDPELLEDLVAAAVNDAIRKAQQIAEEKKSAVSGGMGLPGGLGGMF